jgi:phenylacetate-coenzyme A ligase PaaK-like adenylate-forming protein
MEERIAQAGPAPDAPADRIDALQGQLAEQRRAKGLRTIVQMMAPGSLERTEFKVKRIIDERRLYDEMSVMSS